MIRQKGGKTGKRTEGFTLTEVVVALSLTVTLSAAGYMFFLHNLGTSYMTAGKLQVSNDIRKFTSELTYEARNASYFRLYRSYADVDQVLRDGGSGDMIVLYYVDEEGEVERSIGYFRAAQEGAAGPVRKFDSDVQEYDPTTLPALRDSDTYPMVIELARGLADGRLFYNVYDRSILIRGEIVHPGNLRKEATNTWRLPGVKEKVDDYNLDLEIAPGANMDVFGSVHSPRIQRFRPPSSRGSHRRPTTAEEWRICPGCWRIGAAGR